MAPTSRVWHISGANTGLGLQIALKALKEGDSVVAAVRSPSKVPDSLKVDRVKVLQFDLAWDQAKMDTYADEAYSAFGRIDVLVNNAAYGYLGAIEESEDAAVKEQFDINVFAIIRVLKAFLPHLRKQKDDGGATIINISSVIGFISLPSNALYGATKFALEGISLALAIELAPWNIRIMMPQPGYFRTSFLAAAAEASANGTGDAGKGGNMAPRMAVYDGTPAHEMRDAYAMYDGNQPGDPAQGAARMWEYVADEGMFKGKEKLIRMPLGSDTGAAMKSLIKDLTQTVELYEDVYKSTDFPK